MLYSNSLELSFFIGATNHLQVQPCLHINRFVDLWIYKYENLVIDTK